MYEARSRLALKDKRWKDLHVASGDLLQWSEMRDYAKEKYNLALHAAYERVSKVLKQTHGPI